MKTTFKLLTLLLLVTFSNCETAEKLEYKYANKAKLLSCDLPNGELYKEAVYAFENDIINTYDNQNRNLSKCYSNFLNLRQRGNVKVTELASEHTLKIAKALKDETSLWNTNNEITSLNNSNALIDCIANSIKIKDVKTTFNALLSTNSLTTKNVSPLLTNNSRFVQADGSLKTYVALQFYYSQLLNVKLEDLKNPNPKTQPEPAKPALNGVDINRTPKQTAPVQTVDPKDPHAGHNHD